MEKKENDIIESTREFAELHSMPFGPHVESMLRNAIRETFDFAESELKSLNDKIRAFEKDLELYKPAYERHLSDIENMSKIIQEKEDIIQDLNMQLKHKIGILESLITERCVMEDEIERLKNEYIKADLDYVFRPEVERQKIEIEKLKSDLLEKDKKIKEAFEAGRLKEYSSHFGDDRKPDFETWSKENNIKEE